MTDISINDIKVPAFTHSPAADVAVALWDAGLVEYIDCQDTSTYLRYMVTATAETALWADASHVDDTEGTGEYEGEITDLRLGWAPTYEEALPKDALDALESDVENFLRVAGPFLAAEGVGPGTAGHNFELSRNGHGAGFFDRGLKYGNELQELAKTFGSYGLVVEGHDDDIKVTGYYN